jgi:hypothetical protein
MTEYDYRLLFMIMNGFVLGFSCSVLLRWLIYGC